MTRPLDRLVTLTLGRRRLVTATAAGIFALLFALGILIEDPREPAALAYAVPVALLAIGTGPRVGAGAGVLGGLLYWSAALYRGGDETTFAISYRIALLALLGLLCGELATRLVEREQRAAARLEEAQRIAHIGSWEWDVRTDRVTWSDELHRIFGIERGAGALDYETYLGLIHPDDREVANAAVSASFETHDPFAFRHRLIRPDGAERVLDSNGAVEVENGAVVRMAGTAHDVTERVEAERVAAEAKARLALAAELNDTVVQGLAVARYRLPAGSDGVQEVAATLERAKALVADLLGGEEPQPGSLRRRTPAG
jgi:PAS domain S-box-containing protein